MYFAPALKNIKENLDECGLSDDYVSYFLWFLCVFLRAAHYTLKLCLQLQKISCDLLENAKGMYKSQKAEAAEESTVANVEPQNVIKLDAVQPITIEQPITLYKNVRVFFSFQILHNSHI